MQKVDIQSNCQSLLQSGILSTNSQLLLARDKSMKFSSKYVQAPTWHPLSSIVSYVYSSSLSNHTLILYENTASPKDIDTIYRHISYKWK